jgi:hypothetical protein
MRRIEVLTVMPAAGLRPLFFQRQQWIPADLIDAVDRDSSCRGCNSLQSCPTSTDYPLVSRLLHIQSLKVFGVA